MSRAFEENLCLPSPAPQIQHVLSRREASREAGHERPERCVLLLMGSG